MGRRLKGVNSRGVWSTFPAQNKLVFSTVIRGMSMVDRSWVQGSCSSIYLDILSQSFFLIIRWMAK